MMLTKLASKALKAARQGTMAKKPKRKVAVGTGKKNLKTPAMYEKEIRRLHKLERGMKGSAKEKMKKKQADLMSKQMRLMDRAKLSNNLTKKLAEQKAKPVVKKLMGGALRVGKKVLSNSEIRKKLAGRKGSNVQVIDDKLVSKGLKKKTTSKVPTSTKSPTKKKGASLIEGSGMGSQPKGGPQVKVGRSEVPYMKEAVSDKQKDSLARNKAALGSFEVSKKLKPGSRAKLQDEFQKLKPSARRFEAIKFIKTGKPSKYTPLFSKPGKKLTPAELKPKSDKSILALVGLGGAEYLSKKYQENKKSKVKRKSGGSIKAPKVKTPAWMKGLSEDQIKEMIGGPKVGGERRAKIKKKPSKVRKAKAGGPVVKKMGGGSMNPKKYMNKGGVVKRRSGGKIGDGNSFVADCYK
jgi:hypothetical protein